jgi:hypothetical protein
VIELAEIFRRYGPAYRDQYGDKMPLIHLQVMWAIEHCRTPALGGHVYVCPDCGEVQYVYHSCRNRHCPKCQNGNAQEWLEQQQALLLPVPYFMLTFTLPDALRGVARSHQTLVYDLLFRASAAAAQQLADDPRFVGGQIGLVGVLHTWGRTLTFHPHVHYLCPAGGLASDGQTWLLARPDFLLPVQALSPIFRAKVRDAWRGTNGLAQVPPTVWAQDWVVHCQPVGNGLTALKYLAPYIFRVAISNSRIVQLENDQVTFRYRASDTGQARLCTLDAEEFIRRFLQHVLPKGFVKVRYYGFLSSGLRPRLTTVRQQLRATPATQLSSPNGSDPAPQPAARPSSPDGSDPAPQPADIPLDRLETAQEIPGTTDADSQTADRQVTVSSPDHRVRCLRYPTFSNWS